MADKIIVEFIPAEKWWQRAKWKLVEDYTSVDGKVTAPNGFVSDGASIPWLARPWFSPTGRYFGAAIVHDYILASEGDWKKANNAFHTEVNALGVDNFRKAILVSAVRTWSELKHIFC